MQTAENRPTDNSRMPRQSVPIWLQLYRSVSGGIRKTGTQRAMRPGCVVVPGPFGEDSAQVSFAKRNQIVQAFTPDSSDCSFAKTVRLWRLDRRSQNLQSKASDRLIQMLRKLCISIADQEAVAVIIRNRFPELLQRPVAGRMPRDIERR